MANSGRVSAAILPEMDGCHENSLCRFHEAQRETFGGALAEISAGGKRGHWMWFIFPQLKGLGFSFMADYYGLDGIGEAKAYLGDPVLCRRLHEICDALLGQPNRDAEEIFGHVDALKLRSSMTLFDMAEPYGVFGDILDEFFNGEEDPLTIRLLQKEK